MKKLMLSTALIGTLVAPAMVVPAFAQDVFLPTAAEGDVRASDFIGKRLYASEKPTDMTEYEGAQPDWNDIGEVNDVLMSREGSVDAVLVDIGGFLGMGEHQVAVDMSEIKFVSDSATADDPSDYFLVVTATKDVLEAAPEYQDATAASTMDNAAATDTATAPTADGTDTAATGEMAAGTDATANPDTTATTENAPAADTETMADTNADAATEPATGADMTADTGAAATTGADASADNGFVAAMPEQITSENLTGASVYDATEQRVGEVSELILDPDGNAQQAVVDVGGFLGIGEKPVALDMTALKIMKSADSDELRVYVDQTKDQLEAMPDYEKS